MNITRLTASLLLLSSPLLGAEEKAEAPTQKQAIPEGLVPLTPQETTHFAFLCLEEKTMAKEADIKAALLHWFQLKDESEIVRFKQDPDKGTLAFTIGKARFVATLAEYSLPKPDIQYASNNSLHWPEAEETLLKQQAHYTVTCTSIYPQKWMTSMALSKAVAALAESHKPLGIYWGDASIVHSTPSFLLLAKSDLSLNNKDIPSDLWVGVLLETKQDGTINAYTDGLRVLGYKEMEIHNSKLPAAQVYSILSSLAKHVINNREAIPDHSEIPTSDGRTYQAKYGKSAIERPQEVILISQ